ncbi:hypothetical protein CCUS01_01920 [Colletotrichum cuscutae]|uniref:Uncharacterized protein n=1 Tax=Colletotrichum cuscutae TaxID=1209917 RepID=A0AAI9XJX1_9PEZI|nr:hypothetical protein CCUS01_01920 [Colletotrichum cuscutae]
MTSFLSAQITLGEVHDTINLGAPANMARQNTFQGTGLPALPALDCYAARTRRMRAHAYEENPECIVRLAESR